MNRDELTTHHDNLQRENTRLLGRIETLECRAAEALASQQGLLAAVLDTSVAAVVVMTTDGRIVYANASAEGILGLRASEIVERRYDDPEWRTTAPDGGPWPDEANPFVRVMSTGHPVYDVRHAIEWPDGQRKQLAINGAPIRDDAGKITQLVFSITDVTEQHQQEQKLRESNAWLNLALEAGGMGLWSWHIASGYVRWSEEVAALFGLAPDEFEGTLEAYKELVHPDDLDDVEAALSAALAKAPSTYQVVHRMTRPDGAVHWIEGRGRVLCAADGAPQEIIGTVVDVTPQKEIELALRNSDEAFRTLLETVPSYIVNLGRDRRIQTVNRARPPATVDDLIGQDVLEFLSGGYHKEYVAALDRAFETGELQEYEGSATNQDGVETTHLIRMGPVRKDGVVVSVTVVAIDITELKRAEAALLVSQDQLRHAQRLESIGRLAGGVAHDFNNLLTVVIGCANQLTEGLRSDPTLLESANSILDAANRGAGLTRQLLAFARKQVVVPQVVDLNRSARKAEALLRRLLGARVHLTHDLQHDLWRVEIDPGQLEQVLINLAVNARDAMPSGGRLLVRTENLPAGSEGNEQDQVALSVEDEGSGIRPEDLPLLFEPFFTTKEAGVGTGLGLSTCFGIVRQAGGTLEVTSELGQGSTFRMCLPRTSLERATDDTAPEERLTGREFGARVLLVEDDAQVRRVSQDLLVAAGLEVVPASSAQEALQLYEGSTISDGGFDVVVSDVEMPGMSGTQLVVELRLRAPSLPVVFVSGYSAALANLDQVIAPPLQLVQKPYGPHALLRAVRDVLSAPPTKGQPG